MKGMKITLRAVVLACALAIGSAGCSAPTPSQPTPSQPAPAERVPAAATTVADGQRALVERFVAAINAGDAAGVREVFAAEARFDSVGRIYQGRDEIMDRFLVPEVIEAGGRYTLLSLTPRQGERIVAEYDFSTGSGGREHFTYDCAVRAGRFADCVGRYV